MNEARRQEAERVWEKADATWNCAFNVGNDPQQAAVYIIAAALKEACNEGVDELQNALILGPRILHAEQVEWIKNEAARLKRQP